MPDFWSVPIAPGVLTDLNQQIAKGPDLSFLNNIADNYFKGKDQRYIQDQRDVFKQGIPRVDPNDPNSAIDYNKLAQSLATVQGASAAPMMVELSKLQGLNQMAQKDQGLFPTGAPTPPVTGAVPPSSAPAIPNRQPSQAQPINGYRGGDTSTSVISILGANGVPDEQVGKLAIQVSQKLGVDPNEPLNMSDPNVRAALTDAVRTYKTASAAPAGPVPPGSIPQAQPQGMPPNVAAPQPGPTFDQRFAPAGSAPPTDAAPAPGGPPAPMPGSPPAGPQFAQVQPQAQPSAPPQPVNPNTMTEANASQYEQRANALYQRAAQLAIVNPKISDAYKSAAEANMKQASIIRDALAKNSEVTPTQKDLATGAAATTEAQKLQIQRGDKTYGGIIAQATQYQRDMQPLISVLKPVLNDPNMYSGIAGDWSLNINKVRAALGDQKAAMLQEALGKLTASTVLSQINTQRDQLQEAGTNSSRIFSQQVDLVTKAAPALSNTVYGNRFLISVSERMGDLSEKIADMARQYKIANPLGLDAKFDQQVSDYMKSHPVFTAQERSHPEILGAPTVPPELDRPGNRQAIARWATSLGLKAGDAMRFNDGSVRALQ